MKVAAAIPAYEAEATVGDVVRRTKSVLDTVLVVDDGSTDATSRAAVGSGACLLHHARNRGKGAALRTAFDALFAQGFGMVVTLDADGQHLPEEIPGLVAPLLDGRAQLVSGSRMLGTLRTSRINKFGNWGLKLISFLVTWRWLTDSETGYRAFLAEELYAIRLVSRGYEIESELMMRAMFRGLRIVEVPITVPFAVPGVTVWDGFKIGWFKVSLGFKLRLGLEAA